MSADLLETKTATAVAVCMWKNLLVGRISITFCIFVLRNICGQMRQIKHIQDYEKFRSILAGKLIDGNKFWSYDRESVLRNISDEDTIENTLIYLDIDDINILFRIYPIKEIKKVWAMTMALQDNRYKDLNRFIAGCYFGVKNPDSYVKRVRLHELNNRCR